jgi:hypothetical protein
VTLNSTNAVQKKTMNMQPTQPINDNVMNRHPQTLTRSASYPCENNESERRGLGKRTLGDPQVTMGTSMVVDGSFVSSMSSDISVEESSFRQLQNAVSQVSWVTSFLFILMSHEAETPAYSSTAPSFCYCKFMLHLRGFSLFFFLSWLSVLSK